MPLCSCFGPSVLPVLGYLVPSLGLGNFQPTFLFPILWSLSCLDWYTLLLHRSHIAFIFFSFAFLLSFSLLFWFYLPNNLFVLLYLFALLFKVFSLVFILAIELSNFNFWTWGLLFFQRISPVLLIVSRSSPFSFYFYFSDSLNLGETVICHLVCS